MSEEKVDVKKRFGEEDIMINRLLNRKNLILMVLGIVILLVLVFSVRSCTKVIHSPEEGDEKASVYNGDKIDTNSLLLISGASCIDSTNPVKKGFIPYLRLDGVTVDNYYRQSDVSFGETLEEVEGILSYRGGALRNSATYGNAGIKEGIFSTTWTVQLGESIGLSDELDFTGQPLVVHWNEKTKQILKLNESKKDKETLTEIIYATVDGKVYFVDPETASYSRNPLELGCAVTGTGTICPDGTPLYVVGGGDCSEGDTTEIYVIDLISGEIIYSFGERSNFVMELPEEKYNFSSAALFSLASDCLIAQGENGVIYSFNVNTKVLGSQMTVNLSQMAEYTYSVSDGEGGKKYAEFASGPAAWGSYVYSTDTSGNIICTDINDWHTVWVKNIGESCDATPCIEVDKDTGAAYIYIGTTLDLDKGKKTEGTVYIYKLNASNGDTIWRREYDAHVTKKTNGGFVATACPGEEGLSDYVYFVIAGDGDKKSGRLVCIDKNDGGEHYSVEMKNYSVSDPVAVYGEDGKGYLIVCDNKGNVFMLDGETGVCLATKELGERITSSPVVYENMLILGTGEKLYGIELK